MEAIETKQMTAGQFLKMKRKEANLTKTELGRRANLTRTCIYTLESDRVYPRFSTLMRIIRELKKFTVEEFYAIKKGASSIER